jgi:hypothetical protein
MIESGERRKGEEEEGGNMKERKGKCWRMEKGGKGRRNREGRCWGKKRNAKEGRLGK